MDVLDIHRFPWPSVAETAGLSNKGTGYGWIESGQFDLSPHDEWRVGTGKVGLITLRTAYGLALTATLYRQGVHPARASQVARLFTTTPIHYEDEADRRPPGHLFRTGTTVLVSFAAGGRGPNRTTEIDSGAHSLVRVSPGDDALARILGRHPAAAIVNVNAVVAHVDRSLGIAEPVAA